MVVLCRGFGRGKKTERLQIFTTFWNEIFHMVAEANWMDGMGYLALFAAAFLAAMLFPLSSDGVLFSLVGFGYSIVPCLVVAYIGSLGGGMTNYSLGYLGKWEWVEKHLRVSREAIERRQRQFARWGPTPAALVWIPILGPMFPLMLGFFRINRWATAVFMAVGQTARYAVVAYICYKFVR